MLEVTFESQLSVISIFNLSSTYLTTIVCKISAKVSFFLLPPELLIAKRGVSHTPELLNSQTSIPYHQLPITN
ncbi:hypothetical protein [Anabaena sp. AL09]|uniref:hypothetical protein n=1 Tax=Anabaena sp. AL09 TaxID=1710891 RepID=UPI002628A83A|nr:hypothetical protein [Anabaena sp. AL09]